MEAFGIRSTDLIKNRLSYCIISPLNAINNINDEILKVLKSKNTEFRLNDPSLTKIKNIKEYFEISDNQINSVLMSYSIINKKSHHKIDNLVSALNDIIYEKMALLHIEKIKIS
jgi:iron only hydrogenase large subunit-like protein